jgi:ribosome-associated protein
MASKRSTPRKSSTTTRSAPARAATPRRTPASKAKAAVQKPSATTAKAPRKVASSKVATLPARATTRPAKASKARAIPSLTQVVLDTLSDMKAVDIKSMDVRGITDITDTMVVASGTSDRHVKSIADRVVQRCKEAGFRPYGMEGERDGEWVLLDLQDLVLHVMLPRVREFYALEKLWEGGAARRA